MSEDLLREREETGKADKETSCPIEKKKKMEEAQERKAYGMKKISDLSQKVGAKVKESAHVEGKFIVKECCAACQRTESGSLDQQMCLLDPLMGRCGKTLEI